MQQADLEQLFLRLGYVFKDISLLQHALSHRSYAKANNERLEFLGDAALNFIIADELYRQFPDAKEGDLSRLRASLVKEETLAAIANVLELSHYLRLGVGEQRSGGAERASIQADAVEAVIGAIYLDSNFQHCKTVVVQWFEKLLATIKAPDELKDPKTRLQEYLQAKKMSLPRYEIFKTSGEAHKQMFYIECTVAGLKGKTIGVGSSRRRAEQDAAAKFYEQMIHE